MVSFFLLFAFLFLLFLLAGKEERQVARVRGWGKSLLKQRARVQGVEREKESERLRARVSVLTLSRVTQIIVR